MSLYVGLLIYFNFLFRYNLKWKEDYKMNRIKLYTLSFSKETFSFSSVQIKSMLHFNKLDVAKENGEYRNRFFSPAPY